MKLKALVELRYAGENLLPGDVFEAPDSDANILKLIKKAEDFQEKREEKEEEAQVKVPTGPVKRYRTRQLKAE